MEQDRARRADVQARANSNFYTSTTVTGVN